MKELLKSSDSSFREDERGQLGSLALLAAYSKFSDRSLDELYRDAEEKYQNFREEYF